MDEGWCMGWSFGWEGGNGLGMVEWLVQYMKIPLSIDCSHKQ